MLDDGFENIEDILHKGKSIKGVDLAALIELIQGAFNKVSALGDSFEFARFDFKVFRITFYNPDKITLVKPYEDLETEAFDAKVVGEGDKTVHLSRQAPRILLLKGSDHLAVQGGGAIPTRCWKDSTQLLISQHGNPYCPKAGCGQWWCISDGTWRLASPDPKGHLK